MHPKTAIARGGAAAPQLFLETHWDVVLTAGQSAGPEAESALEQLCQTYWWPLYACVRRRGYTRHDAQDLTQEFFARLLGTDSLRTVDRRKGKFRSFLLAALEHFLANEWRRTHTQKRGGQVAFVSIDAESAERSYVDLPTGNLTPAQVFEQQWAMTLLTETIARLQGEFTAAGKEALFEATKVFLTGEKHAPPYAKLALELGTTEAALKTAVSRMRQRYGELLGKEIAKTVSTPDEVKEELYGLFSALSQ